MQQIKPTCLSEIIQQVLHRIEKRVSNSNEKQLTTQEYIELNALFQEDVLTKALHIIDTQIIVSYRKEEHSEIELIEIPGVWPSQTIYKLFPNTNFCHCPFFKDEILKAPKPAYYTCEHVIAARLARILNKLKIEILPKHKFNYILKQIAAP